MLQKWWPLLSYPIGGIILHTSDFKILVRKQGILRNIEFLVGRVRRLSAPRALEEGIAGSIKTRYGSTKERMALCSLWVAIENK